MKYSITVASPNLEKTYSVEAISHRLAYEKAIKLFNEELENFKDSKECLVEYIWERVISENFEDDIDCVYKAFGEDIGYERVKNILEEELNSFIECHYKDFWWD